MAVPGAPVLAGQPESLSELSLRGVKLPAILPTLVQKDVDPEFTREFLRVEWRTGDPIDLYVIRPARASKPLVTLFLYGFPSETDRFRDDAYCRMVTRRGYAAVGFVSALTGQRFHGRGLTEWFVNDLPEALATSVHDVQLILNYLETRQDLDTTQAGMFGQGSGGTIAALAASVEPRLKRIDLIDPWGDWPAWMAGSQLILDEERPHLTETGFLASVAQFDPLRVLPSLSSERVHLLDVEYDRDTPPAAKRALEASLRGGAGIEIYKTMHEFQAAMRGGDAMLAWLQPQPEKAESSAAKAQRGPRHLPEPTDAR